VPVPDLDRLPRGVRKGWGRVARAVEGAQPPEVVADAVEKALAKTLRLCGDLAWLEDLARAVTDAQTADSVQELEAYLRTLDPTITRGVESAFIDVARHKAVWPDPDGVAVSADTLLAQGLLRMIDKLCLGPMRPDLLPRWNQDQRDWGAYTEAIRALVDAEGISRGARRRDFDVSTLRAPRSRLDRPGTADLLHAPIT
jgi:hypothetical protein